MAACRRRYPALPTCDLSREERDSSHRSRPRSCFESLVTIDKGSRIPPLELPIKAEWFGIPSFREVGVVSREVRYKISVLDERANKALEARRKGTSGLREKFSFPLADGSRWMPHKAKPFFQAELNAWKKQVERCWTQSYPVVPKNGLRASATLSLATRTANTRSSIRESACLRKPFKKF